MCHVVTTVDRVVDRLRLRVELRAAELGISLREMARRMGVSHARLHTLCARPGISREAFAKIVAAAGGEGEWLTRPLPQLQPMTAEKMRAALRRKIR